MAENVIYVRGTRKDVRHAIKQAIAIAAGNASGDKEAAAINLAG